MALEVPTYLVRHGRYDGTTGDITDEGRQDMSDVRAWWLHHDLGNRALILGSTARRAIQSARYLAECLDNDNVVLDSRLNVYGNNPRELNDFEGMLEQTIQSHGITIADHDGLIVVTHAPLINTAVNHSLYGVESIKHGVVYPYELGSWVPPAELL